MADQQPGATTVQADASSDPADAVDSNAAARTDMTTGAAAAGAPAETGGLTTPGTGTGMHGTAGARDLTGVAVSPDLGASAGGDAQDVLTQVDGTYDANAGGTGATGSTATPNTLGGVGASLGGLSGGR